MLLDVSGRSQQSFFLARPQGEANRALRMHSEAGENARRLHDHGAAGAIVRRTVAGDPAIQVRAGHDIAGMRVVAGNVGKYVIGIVVRVLEMDAAVDFHPHLAALGEPRQLAVVLGGQFDAR